MLFLHIPPQHFELDPITGANSPNKDIDMHVDGAVISITVTQFTATLNNKDKPVQGSD
jgi:hypothetical protein